MIHEVRELHVRADARRRYGVDEGLFTLAGNAILPNLRAVRELAAKIVDKFPECTRYTKQQVNYWKESAWFATVGHARDWLSTHFTTLEPYEGMRAFVEKRKPNYRGLREAAATGGSSEFLWGPYRHECGACGAKGIPAEFAFCGRCGARLETK